MRDEELDAVLEPFLAPDLAREVATIYGERRHFNVDVGHATQAVFETFRELLHDPNEGPVIFLALAALQLRDGAVLAPIRDAAIALIDTGEAQRAWRPLDVMVNRQRKTALAALSELLATAAIVD